MPRGGGAYGGEVGKVAEFEVTMPCTAKPALTATGTLPAMADPEADWSGRGGRVGPTWRR